MDVSNKVILLSRLGQACEGKVQEAAAVRADARFARLVEGVVGVEGLTETQVQSVKEGLRGLGVVVGV